MYPINQSDQTQSVKETGKLYLMFTISKSYRVTRTRQVPEGEYRCGYDIFLTENKQLHYRLKGISVVITLFLAGNSHISAVYVWYKIGVFIY